MSAKMENDSIVSAINFTKISSGYSGDLPHFISFTDEVLTVVC